MVGMMLWSLSSSLSLSYVLEVDLLWVMLIVPSSSLRGVGAVPRRVMLAHLHNIVGGLNELV